MSKMNNAGYEIAFLDGVEAEQERILQIVDELSGHRGQTHYEGKQCFWCDFHRAIKGEQK